MLGAGFAVGIELAGDGIVGLHELAGVVLLAVTVALLVAVRRLPSGAGRRRLLGLGFMALLVLVTMGATGAALAAGWLGPAWDRLPLVVLGVYVLDALAIARLASRREVVPSAPPPPG